MRQLRVSIQYDGVYQCMKYMYFPKRGFASGYLFKLLPCAQFTPQREQTCSQWISPH